jgi:hypothetical protein
LVAYIAFPFRIIEGLLKSLATDDASPESIKKHRTYRQAGRFLHWMKFEEKLFDLQNPALGYTLFPPKQTANSDGHA